jgi:GMP synthase-like glutamine amidotransferase
MQEIEELDKKKVKTVGISFGHQAIAQALGGHVTRNPKVRLLLLSNLHNCTKSNSFAVSKESKVKAICVC